MHTCRHHDLPDAWQSVIPWRGDTSPLLERTAGTRSLELHISISVLGVLFKSINFSLIGITFPWRLRGLSFRSWFSPFHLYLINTIDRSFPNRPALRLTSWWILEDIPSVFSTLIVNLPDGPGIGITAITTGMARGYTMYNGLILCHILRPGEIYVNHLSTDVVKIEIVQVFKETTWTVTSAMTGLLQSHHTSAIYSYHAITHPAKLFSRTCYCHGTH